jgi:TonB family protein
MKTALLSILALAAAGPVLAQTPPSFTIDPDEPNYDTPADWSFKPQGADTVKFYPDEALDRTIGGKVTLRCTVRANGRAEDCSVVEEAPWGLGFGAAAVRLIQVKGMFKPARLNGKVVDGAKVRVPLQFTPPVETTRYIVFRPIFARAPSFEAVAAAWPTGSDAAEATVVLRCSLQPDGGLKDCASAGKVDAAFYEAAKGLSGHFQVKVTPEEAKTLGEADVLIPIRFVSPASVEGRAIAVKDPWWTTSVNPEKVLSVYPAKAAEAGVSSGRGVADCLVAPDGKLTDCKVSREKPAEMGFGLSAVAIAQLMQMNPWSSKGRPVTGARVKLPIDFNLAEEAAK